MYLDYIYFDWIELFSLLYFTENKLKLLSLTDCPNEHS